MSDATNGPGEPGSPGGGPGGSGGATGPWPGLCASCAHHRVIENRRGSRFHLCEKSKKDPRFPKYPPIPVLRCAGYLPHTPVGEAPGRD